MKARKYAAGGPVDPKKPTVGGQQTKQTRVEQGVNPIPSEYDMTTAAGRSAYMEDRRAAQQNRIARKAGQRNMTAAERNADNAQMGKEAQAKVVTGASPAKIVIGGGKGIRVNPDVKASASQRGSQAAGLRPKTSSSTVLPRRRRPMNP